MCSLVVNGVRARTRPRHHGLPAPHAPLQGRRHDHRSSRGAPRPSRSSRIWSSIGAPSIASSRPAATCRSTVGGAPDGNAIPIPKDVAEVGDGLGRVHRLRRLRRGVQERVGAPVHEREDLAPRAAAAGPAASATAASCAMIAQADAEGFGSCSNEGECEAVCPKEIPISNIARMTREYVRAQLSRMQCPALAGP